MHLYFLFKCERNGRSPGTDESGEEMSLTGEKTFTVGCCVCKKKLLPLSRFYGGLAQLARALAWHARGHEFESRILHAFPSAASAAEIFSGDFRWIPFSARHL